MCVSRAGKRGAESAKARERNKETRVTSRLGRAPREIRREQRRPKGTPHSRGDGPFRNSIVPRSSLKSPSWNSGRRAFGAWFSSNYNSANNGDDGRAGARDEERLSERNSERERRERKRGKRASLSALWRIPEKRATLESSVNRSTSERIIWLRSGRKYLARERK